jgi:hypothetical protein
MAKASKLNKKLKTILKTASYQYGELMSKRRLSPEERKTMELYNLIEEVSGKIEGLDKKISQKYSQSKARTSRRRSQFLSSLPLIEENPTRGAGTVLRPASARRSVSTRRSYSPK